MSNFTRMLLAAVLLAGSATGAMSSVNTGADDQGSLRIPTSTMQVAQFNSAPSQSSNSFDRRLESYGGY